MNKVDCEQIIAEKKHLLDKVVEIIRGQTIKTEIKGLLIKLYCDCYSEIDGASKTEHCKPVALINVDGVFIRVLVEELP